MLLYTYATSAICPTRYADITRRRRHATLRRCYTFVHSAHCDARVVTRERAIDTIYDMRRCYVYERERRYDMRAEERCGEKEEALCHSG